MKINEVLNLNKNILDGIQDVIFDLGFIIVKKENNVIRMFNRAKNMFNYYFEIVLNGSMIENITYFYTPMKFQKEVFTLDRSKDYKEQIIDLYRKLQNIPKHTKFIEDFV